MALKSDKNISEIFFACLAIADLYNSLFDKLWENFSCRLQVFDNTGYYFGRIYYNWYSKLVKSLCKNSDPNFKKDNNNIICKKNTENDENNSIADEKNGWDNKSSSRNEKDNDIVIEKNMREAKVINNNNMPSDPDFKTFIDIIIQLDFGEIAEL